MSARLSNAVIADIKQALGKAPAVDGAVEPAEAWSLLTEIEERRAADLTPEEIETVKTWEAFHERGAASIDDWTPEHIVTERRAALVIVRKILAAHGAAP